MTARMRDRTVVAKSVRVAFRRHWTILCRPHPHAHPRGNVAHRTHRMGRAAHDERRAVIAGKYVQDGVPKG